MIRTILFVAGVMGAGCSAAAFVRSADREANAISAEKMRVVEDFRRDLVDPRESAIEPREPQAPPVEVPELLTLEDAVRIAVGHGREYKTQEEAYYLSALGLGLTRHSFLDPIFGGSLSYNASDGKSVELSDSTALAVSATQVLPTGGSLSLSGSTSIDTADAGSGRVQDSGFSGTLSISQALWRGAGRKIAFEPLTQAERDVVYAARGFEVFRQNFTIGVIQSYLNLVTSKQGLRITENQVKAQEYALKLAQAQFRVGRSGQEDVLRAEEGYLNALNGFLDAQEAYKVQKDRFKIDLGLPIDVDFEIVDEIPEPQPFDLDPDGAVVAALHNRLDLLTQRERLEDTIRGLAIARNALRPDLNLDASVSVSSGVANSLRDLSPDNRTGSLALTLTFPFERRAERNSYRSALIALDQARRGLSQTEDNIVLSIRALVRDLKTQILTIANERKNVVVLQRRIIRANIDFQAGLASNRDIVEATNALASAENRLLARYVAYHVARLNLRQQMGLLFVDKEGMIIP